MDETEKRYMPRPMIEHSPNQLRVINGGAALFVHLRKTAPRGIEAAAHDPTAWRTAQGAGLADLLADLMHYAHAKGLDWHDIAQRARGMFEQETDMGT